MLQRFIKILLLQSAATTSAIIAQPVLAQAAASQASEEGGLTDIIVTARRIGENQQSTPLAISTITSVDLAAKAVQTASDLQNVTPGLTVQAPSNNPAGFQFNMRSQVQSDTSAYQPGSVGLYLDDVYIGGAQIAGRLLNTDDLSRVEVLKGPQGTLYGRNVTGGVVKFVTAQPTNEFEGLIGADIGNYSRREIKGMVNIPLGEMVALRLNGTWLDRNGYSEDVNNNRDLEDDHYWTIRGALRAELSSKFTATLAGWYGKQHDNGLDARTMYVDPNNANAIRNIIVSEGINGATAATFAPLVFGAAAGFTPAQISAAQAAYTAAQPIALQRVQDYFNAPRSQARGSTDRRLLTRNVSKMGGGALSLNYDITDDLALKSVTAYTYALRDGFFNVGGGPWVPGYTNQSGEHQQWSEELQLSGTAFDGRLKFTGGLYYLKQQIYDNRKESSTFGSFPRYLGQLGLGLTNGSFAVNDIEVRSIAGFGQATFEVVDGFRLTGGIRYTDEKFDITTTQIQRASISTGGRELCTAPAPTTSATPLAQCFASGSSKFTNWSYTVSADWEITDGVMVYAKHATGFKAGGLNAFNPGATPFIPFRPETSKDYEVGLKSQFWGRRGRFNFAYYHTDYNNIHRSITSIIFAGPPPQLGTGVQNAATAKIDGFEAELTLAPVEGLTLLGTVGYTRPKYGKYQTVNLSFPGGIQDLSGEPFQGVSRWTASFSGTYKYNTLWGSITPGFVYYWRERYALFASDLFPRTPTGASTPASLLYQGSYGLLDATLTFDWADKEISAKLWTKNLTNKRYISGMTGLVNVGLGYTWNTYGRPRTYGIAVTKHF